MPSELLVVEVGELGDGLRRGDGWRAPATAIGRWPGRGGCSVGFSGSSTVVVAGVIDHAGMHMPFAEDQHPVGDLGLDGEHEPHGLSAAASLGVEHIAQPGNRLRSRCPRYRRAAEQGPLAGRRQCPAGRDRAVHRVIMEVTAMTDVNGARGARGSRPALPSASRRRRCGRGCRVVRTLDGRGDPMHPRGGGAAS